MPNLTTVSPATFSATTPLRAVEVDPLRDAAKQLEASFLTEMLKSAGLGKSREGLGGGGAGEEQFSSFLIRAQAEEMTEAGGIGLAESIYQALKESPND
ncbi:flagellar rod assembly protein/muramidase FlgJ [Phaeobacter sp. CECT 5382]|uniref:rod-binding protein n=1 Tax=Rhodobacterales TaxID=204455 RepID=UPI0006DB0CF0|nr:rod-binding protein [Phaeobacter sp. CECT 5382]CUH86628.1 flagellar rod assembly protein/muramidase FlgJ [Phaeobacter sp. CECT 5382]